MILGQENGVRALMSLTQGRSSLPLLLEGEEGVGRLSAALESIGNTGSSGDRKRIAAKGHPDVHLLASEAGKEIGVDAVREFTGYADKAPSTLPFRYFILDGAENMSTPAANALLKPLEDRVGASRFILLTSSFRRVLRPLRGRCARVYFPLLAEEVVLKVLAQYEGEPEKARAYARLGGGSIGRALALWQANGLSFRDRVFNLFQLSRQGDIAALFEEVDALVKKDANLLVRFVLAIGADLVVPFEVRRNIDISSDIDILAKNLGESKVEDLWRKLRSAQFRHESSYINLNLQLKAAFL